MKSFALLLYTYFIMHQLKCRYKCIYVFVRVFILFLSTTL